MIILLIFVLIRHKALNLERDSCLLVTNSAQLSNHSIVGRDPSSDWSNTTLSSRLYKALDDAMIIIVSHHMTVLPKHNKIRDFMFVLSDFL